MSIICPSVDSDEFEKYWATVSKGDPLPNGAVLAGKTGADGVLYVGMSNKFEPGKYNVDSGKPGGKIHNLWTHAGGRHDSGYVLVCPDEKKVVWQSYKKGDKLEQYPNAFQATPDGQPGFCGPGMLDKDDGVLYIGREGPNGSIGKINLDGDRIHNLWIQNISRLDGGQILTFENSTAAPAPAAPGKPIVITSIGWMHIGTLPAGRTTSEEIKVGVIKKDSKTETKKESFSNNFKVSASYGPASAENTMERAVSQIAEMMSSTTMNCQQNCTTTWTASDKDQKIWGLTVKGENGFIYVNPKFTATGDKKPEELQLDEIVW